MNGFDYEKIELSRMAANVANKAHNDTVEEYEKYSK